jgi:hypothetical protein
MEPCLLHTAHTLISPHISLKGEKVLLYAVRRFKRSFRPQQSVMPIMSAKYLLTYFLRIYVYFLLYMYIYKVYAQAHLSANAPGHLGTEWVPGTLPTRQLLMNPPILES